MNAMWSGEQSRQIIMRIVIECELVLQTPTHFGNGDGDDVTDMPLLLDPHDEAEGRVTPLLTGASLAGALRSYLREVEHGYGARVEKGQGSASVLLFGGLKRDDDGKQSALTVDDSRGAEDTSGIEMRDGVRLDPSSRTAADKAKFDLQLWQAGTRFRLRFELCIRKEDDATSLKQALLTALAGLSNGGITLGARKRRGYGSVKAGTWRVRVFDLLKASDLIAWVAEGEQRPSKVVTDLADELGVTPLPNQWGVFHLQAEFALAGSMLIRSGGVERFGPDDEHLRTRQVDGENKPVLSGTSLAGALRGRSLKICRTLGREGQAKQLVDSMWGADMDEIRRRRSAGDLAATPHASRVAVSERVIDDAVTELVQSRVSIDRFTGGALDTALFNQQPVFGKADTKVTVEVRLPRPEAHEIGLLLLLLKDLWTSDLALGGESSVGRGRLQGRQAVLSHASAETIKSWTLRSRDEDEVEVTGGSRDELEEYVRAFHRRLQEMAAQ